MFTGISLGAVVAIIAVIALLGIIASGYVKAPPDTAFIISGLRKKIIIGKSSIKIPFLERLDKLSLKLIPIDVKTEAAVPTADYINIQVDAAVNVKVSSEPEKLKQAAENFLNQNTQYIAQVAREVLEGNMREIVGRMRLEEMVSDRQKFADLVKENAEPDLAAFGACRGRDWQREFGAVPQLDPALRTAAHQGRRHQVHLRRADELGDEDVGRVVVEFQRGADLLDAAAVEHDDALRQRHRLDLVVGDVDDGRAQAAVQAGDLHAHLHAQRGIEVGQRLVEQEQLGLARDRAPDRHALALAAGQVLGLAL